MNTQTCRLVFNAARACMVAVAETARGCGKGWRVGGTRVKRRKSASAKPCKPNRPLALVGWTYSAINSGVNVSSTSSNHFESHSITVGAALSGTVGSKITAISDNLQLASNTSNDRLKGAATLKAGYDAYKLVNGGAAEGIATQGTTKDGDPGGSAFGVSVSVGINSSKQDNSSATTVSRHQHPGQRHRHHCNRWHRQRCRGQHHRSGRQAPG